jgi:hypothetical protein
MLSCKIDHLVIDSLTYRCQISIYTLTFKILIWNKLNTDEMKDKNKTQSSPLPLKKNKTKNKQSIFNKTKNNVGVLPLIKNSGYLLYRSLIFAWLV